MIDKKGLRFTFDYIRSEYEIALDNGYKFITCAEYAHKKDQLPDFTIVNRVDIDLSVVKAGRLMKIFNDLDIKATFFVRLHAPEYNPFSFENYRILKSIRDNGHEIGYHSEIVDQAKIWSESEEDCLIKDIDVLNRMLDINIQGIASHGGLTGYNNLDFWDNRSAKDYGLLYEAYNKSDDFNLFDNSFYLSDSEWTQWKCYSKGLLQTDDRRGLSEHIQDRHKLIYLLIHPDTYYDNHCYE